MKSAYYFLRKFFRSVIFINCAKITALFVLQLSIMNFLKHQKIVIDLLTPFLTFLFVKAKLSISVSYIIWSSLLLEGAFNYAHGFYFTSYWAICIFILSIRHYISWEKPSSWICICTFTQFFLILMESLLIQTRQHYSYLLSNTYLISLISRILVETLFSFFLYKKHNDIKAF